MKQESVPNLLPRINSYLQQLAPHMQERDGVLLLIEARDEIESLAEELVLRDIVSVIRKQGETK